MRLAALRTDRKGVSVIETAIVMTMIVVVVVVLLGGLSGQIATPFSSTSDVLAEVAPPPTNVEGEAIVEKAEQKSTEDISNILVRFGIFAAVVFAFMAYTTTFIAKAEGGPQNPVEEELAPRVKAKTPKKHSLADFLLDRRSQIGRTIRKHSDERDCIDLTVEMFMTKNPITAKITDELSDVIKLMRNRGFRHMMILGTDDAIAGIISDRDLVETEGKSIADIMTPDPFTVESCTSINIAITLLVKNRISALPVVQDTDVVGVLTRSDLLVTLQCLMVNIQQQLVEARA